MTLRAWLTLAALTLPALAGATPATVAQQLAQGLGGLAQACPPAYPQASCVRVSGDAVAVAGRIFTTFPALLPNPWRDGPEGGLSTDIEAGATTLSAVPRGDAQALLVLQPGTAAVTPAAAPLPAFTIDNPTGSYFVILDGDQPVRDPAALKPGTYPMIVSATGKATQRVSVTVPASGLTRLTIPTLYATPARADRAGLQLPLAPGYVFIVFTGGGTPVLDLADLLPGYYDVRSYWNGTVGPVAFLQEAKLGATLTPAFQGTFQTKVTASPTFTAPTPVVTPSAAPASSTSGMCWVNGYRRSNGTYVSGYYRRC
ncbi:hypothetical protein [Deinococcus radiotolerans]|uniref:Uncharacterized protein n=1 Tax=Deinococcus radiotolerans TaxID=1309407 RepID=A0ABQ2FQX0_9DEIO|nr:hypothetical protein [Deinococcus radiotolerans]GGL17661.1 hypothetical protein GCM10010844_40620 [Deinococcus radiotolerans]